MVPHGLTQGLTAVAYPLPPPPESLVLSGAMEPDSDEASSPGGV